MDAIFPYKAIEFTGPGRTQWHHTLNKMITLDDSFRHRRQHLDRFGESFYTKQSSSQIPSVQPFSVYRSSPKKQPSKVEIYPAQ